VYIKRVFYRFLSHFSGFCIPSAESSIGMFSPRFLQLWTLATIVMLIYVLHFLLSCTCKEAIQC